MIRDGSVDAILIHVDGCEWIRMMMCDAIHLSMHLHTYRPRLLLRYDVPYNYYIVIVIIYPVIPIQTIQNK